MKNRHQAEVNAFPLVAAFSDKQFAEAMAELGLAPEDTDKIYGIPGTGAFFRREDAPRFHEMFERHERERQEAIDADTKGDGFIYEMFLYELANHEYTYTNDFESTFEALDLTPEDFKKNPALDKGLVNAAKTLRKWDEERDRKLRKEAIA